MRHFQVLNQNVTVEPRYADKPEQLPPLAAELVQLNVDLINHEWNSGNAGGPAGNQDDSNRFLPTAFGLAVKMKAAEALGVTVPQSILIRANQVID